MDLKMGKMRKSKGLLQKDMANKLGVKTFTYGAWERGDRKFSFDIAYDIADILGCTLDALAGRDVPDEAFSGDASVLVSYFNKCTSKRKYRLIAEARDYARLSEGENDSRARNT